MLRNGNVGMSDFVFEECSLVQSVGLDLPEPSVKSMLPGKAPKFVYMIFLQCSTFVGAS